MNKPNEFSHKLAWMEYAGRLEIEMAELKTDLIAWNELAIGDRDFSVNREGCINMIAKLKGEDYNIE